MKEAVLSAMSRDKGGKNYSRRLRREGRVPASLYGPERKPQSLSLALTDLEKLMRETQGFNVLLSIDVDGSGGGADKSLIRSIQRDPVDGQILHVDLHQISMARPINLMIPVNITGIPDGVKNDGGVMQQIIREIEISCLPTEIPDALQLDVSELGIHDSIHISDITIEKATVLMDESRTIVTVVPPTVSVEPTTDEEEVEGEAVEGEAAEGAEEGKEKEGDDKKEEEKKK